MSRHNRRRTRLSHKPYRTFQLSPFSTTLDSPSGPSIPTISSLTESIFPGTLPGHHRLLLRSEGSNSQTNNKSSTCPYPCPCSCRPLFSCEHQVMAAKEKVKDTEKEKEKVKEQIRVFGGGEDEGDEDGLCDKMMEFFGGLDFI